MARSARSCILVATLLAYRGGAHALTVAINATVGIAAAAIPIAEAWASLTFWDYESFNVAVPANTTAQYPFLKRMELFTATGGCCECAVTPAGLARVSLLVYST